MKNSYTVSNNQTKQILAALHRVQREEELAQHGKSICYSQIVKSKKIYTRKTKHKLLNMDY